MEYSQGYLHFISELSNTQWLQLVISSCQILTIILLGIKNGFRTMEWKILEKNKDLDEVQHYKGSKSTYLRQMLKRS